MNGAGGAHLWQQPAHALCLCESHYMPSTARTLILMLLYASRTGAPVEQYYEHIILTSSESTCVATRLNIPLFISPVWTALPFPLK